MLKKNVYKREFTELDPNPGPRVVLFAIKRRSNSRVGRTVVSGSTGCPGKCCEDEITVSQFVTAGSLGGLPARISLCRTTMQGIISAGHDNES